MTVLILPFLSLIVENLADKIATSQSMTLRTKENKTEIGQLSFESYSAREH